MPVGRFAPSPTGALHLGNLRTAMIAWCWSRHSGDRFVLRMEDLDRVTSSRDHEVAQQHDLAAIGLDWDGPVLRQSDRFDLYADALADLDRAGLLYPCYCTRREIAAAASAPNAPVAEGYPGTCRELDAGARAERAASGRPPALRFRSDRAELDVPDLILGTLTSPVDDVVVRRNDGVPAYHLAVVVDDADQSIDLVVRGDDLTSVTPSQVALQRALGLPTPNYGHVPLVVGPTRERLAKRDGATTLADRLALGDRTTDVVRWLLTTTGLDASGATPAQLMSAAASTFGPDRIVRGPLVLSAELVTRPATTPPAQHDTGRSRENTAAASSSDEIASPPPSGSERA